ncbi:MAG: AsmA family protein, partial [Fimbriimonadaceae bacterium]|nr:AsmA family protein [Alphaproteobacteria bacterium]
MLALFSAMVAPFFIDWNAYRGVAETRLSQAFGLEVVIDGPLDVRILPFPTLGIENLEFRQDGAQYPLLIVPDLKANLALTPILRGRVEVTDITLRQPIVTVPASAGGLPEIPRVPMTGIAREVVKISRFDMIDGTFVTVDAQGTPMNTVTGITFSGQAVSLEGPFKIEGRARTESESYAYKISTGRLRADGAIRAKIDLEPVSSPRSLFLDAFIGAAEGMLAFDGSFRITQTLDDATIANAIVQLGDIPWELTGNIQGPLENLTLRDLKFDAGPQARKITLEGAARVQLLPAPHMEALLSSRQIDFDRVLGGQGETGTLSSPGQVMEVFGEIARLLSRNSMPVELSVSTDVAILGGDLVEGLAIDVFSRDGLVEIRRAEALLPGKSSFAFSGNVDPENASVDGNLRLDSRHTAALAKWLQMNPQEFGPLFAPGERINLALTTRLAVNP